MSEAVGADLSGTARKLRKLHDATREMIDARSRPELYDTATETAAGLLGFEYNTVREYDPERELLVTAAASPALVGTVGERPTYERGETVQWNAFETGRLLVFPDVAAIEDDADRNGDGSMIVVPLGEHGVLTLGSPRARDIADGDVELARVLGVNLKSAIERVDRMAALRDREERLRRKNDRLDRFNELIAHEFRNPIGILSGHLGLIDGADGDEPHIETARKTVDRINRLTESLLDFVREDTLSGPVEPIDLGDLAVDVFGELCPEAASLTLTAPVTVAANRSRLRTVLENLFDNAVTHGGPSVHVWIGRLPEGGFYVADDGPGFPDDSPEELLSYRATGGSERTGLGLAIVRDIARAHDWEIGLDSSRGGGARVEFSTRSSPSSPSSRSERPSSGSPRSRSSEP